MTLCPQGSTKYAIAERLGNYIDSKKLSKELTNIKKMFLFCLLTGSAVRNIYEKNYEHNCLKTGIFGMPFGRKIGCRVCQFSYYISKSYLTKRCPI